MKNVGNGKVVVERGHYKNNGGQQHSGKSGDSGTTGGFANRARGGVLTEQQRQKAYQETIPA